MKPLKVLLLHYFPLEQYPPAMNWIDVIGRHSDIDLTVLTTKVDDRDWYRNDRVNIVRTRFPSVGHGRVRRLLRMLHYPRLGKRLITRLRPDVIWHCEPHSALASAWGHRRRRDSRVFIHYHEYRDPGHYHDPGMRWVHWVHRCERRRLYPVAEWISHTNPVRRAMFAADYPEVSGDNLKVLANYPPASWQRPTGDQTIYDGGAEPLRMIYVGALSARDTYLPEVLRWVTSMNGRITLDLYSGNVASDAKDCLQQNAGPWICHHAEPVRYPELPDLLRRYHVGLIMYRGTTKNYVHNETNKLFEYLVCGLDVLYPGVVKGIDPHRRDDVRPRVLRADFEHLDDGTTDRLCDAATLPHEPIRVDCESAMREILAAMLETPDRNATPR